MIDARELRLGNFVLLNDNWFQGKYAEITCIQPHCVLIKHFVGTPKLGDIDPIPLTPEVLEKCGFAYDGEKESYEKSGAEIRRNSETTFYHSNDVFLTHIDFLHTLQNWWFANTCEELTVNL